MAKKKMHIHYLKEKSSVIIHHVTIVFAAIKEFTFPY